MQESLSQAGLEAFGQGNYSQALTLWDQALRLDPNQCKLWNCRGNVLAELKRYSEALVAYEKAIALNRHYHQAWYNRGLVLVELGAYGNGIECFHEAIRLHRDPVYLHRLDSIWLKKQLVSFVL